MLFYYSCRKKRQQDVYKRQMEDELCLLTYAVLACLKGLKEQGCNGPVTEAIGTVSYTHLSLQE